MKETKTRFEDIPLLSPWEERQLRRAERIREESSSKLGFILKQFKGGSVRNDEAGSDADTAVACEVESSFAEMVGETLASPEFKEKAEQEGVARPFKKDLRCMEPHCPNLVSETEMFCPLHAEVHANDEEFKRLREAERAEREKRRKQTRKQGLKQFSASERQKYLASLSPEEQQAVLEEEADQRRTESIARAKKEAERRARQLEVSRQGPKGTAGGQGGGKPVTNPNSKRATKKRRKEEQRRKGKGKKGYKK